MGWRTGLVVALLSFASTATADTRQSVSVRHWPQDAGIPGAVTGLMRASDGTLWIGTHRGLVRFDGASFTPLPLPGQPQTVVTALAGEADGRVWVGTATGLWSWRDQSWSRIDFEFGAVRSLQPMDDGQLLVGTSSALYLRDGESIERLSGADEKVSTITRGGGRILVSIGVNRGVFELVGRKLLPIPLASPRPGESRQAVSMRVADDGTGWVATKQGLLRLPPGGAPAIAEPVSGLLSTYVTAVELDGDGGLWVSTIAGGIQRVRNGLADRPVAGASSRAVWPLVSDGSGGVWLGSDQGLTHLRPTPFVVVKPDYDMTNAVVWSAYLDPKDGAILLGLDSNGVARVAEGETDPLAAPELESQSVTSTLRSTDGALWFGTLSRGLLRLEGAEMTSVLGPDREEVTPVDGLLQTSDGTIWVGTTRRVLRWRDGRWLGEHAAGDRNHTFEETPDRKVWVGGDGVARYDGGVAEEIAPELANLPGVVVLRADGDDLWIVDYFEGLLLWSAGKLTRFGDLEPRLAGTGSALLDDGLGRAWYGAEDRLIVATWDDLRKLAQGSISRLPATSFDHRDGLPCALNAGGQTPASRDNEGRLWFACDRGGLLVDPRGLTAAPPPRPPAVTSVLINGRAQSPVGGDTMRLESRSARVEIRYVSPAPASAHHLAYRYRLEGHDATWISGTRDHVARYEDLAEGSYRFRLQVARDGSSWIDADSALDITVEWRFFEHRWPWALLALIAVGLAAAMGFGLARYRQRTLRARADELQQVVDERTRELSRSVAELEAFSYSVSHDLRAPLRHAASYTELLREELGPRLDGEEEAARYMRTIESATARMGELIDALLRLAKLGKAELHLRPVSLPAMIAELRGELPPPPEGQTVSWNVADEPLEVFADRALFRQVMANLLSNARKYSAGRRDAKIDIDWHREGDEVVVCVRDNGVGFDMAHADKLFTPFKRLHGKNEFEGIGIGLALASRIVARLGGRIWCEAEVDRGASFFVALPAA